MFDKIREKLLDKGFSDDAGWDTVRDILNEISEES